MVQTSQKTIHGYQIASPAGLCAEISTLGASVVSFWCPNQHGILEDIVLGFDTAQDYLSSPGNVGGSIGRFANRIAYGRFRLDGQWVQTHCNRGNHSIHGGPRGFHTKTWTVQAHTPTSLTLSLESPHGDQGFPGTLSVQGVFSFPEEDVFSICYTAQTDCITVCNLTNHTYWNLNGHTTGHCAGQTLCVCASSYLETDAEQIPTGKCLPISQTQFPLQREDGQPLDLDRSYILSGTGFRWVGRIDAVASGRRMDISSNQPCAQIYTGGHLPPGMQGKQGVRYGPFSGVCFETQGYPDAPNHPAFPSAVLYPHTVHTFHTQYQFRVLPHGGDTI